MFPHSRVLLLGAFLAPLGCAARSPSSVGSAAPASSTVLTREDLQGANARNAYEAVEQLRPRWLVVRSMRSFSMETEIVVFQDRMYLGNQEALQRIGLDGIDRIEYVDGATAQATLPGIKDRHVQGAIVVHMTREPPR